jgi:hypothetical protein
MRLTWKDAVSTLFTAAVVVVYVAFLSGTSAWLISSGRGAVTAVLVLGVVGGCALGQAADLYQGRQRTSQRIFRAVETLLGAVALVAAVVGLISGATAALTVLVVATLALWLTATIRHAFTVPGELGPTPGSLEVTGKQGPGRPGSPEEPPAPMSPLLRTR